MNKHILIIILQFVLLSAYIGCVATSKNDLIETNITHENVVVENVSAYLLVVSAESLKSTPIPQAIFIDPKSEDVADYINIMRNKVQLQINSLGDEYTKYYGLMDEAETIVEIHGDIIIIKICISLPDPVKRKIIGHPIYANYHFDIRTKEILYPKLDD